ncbi:FGGY-family carbohydrate kinase [Microbacterium sp. NPDC089318]
MSTSKNERSADRPRCYAAVDLGASGGRVVLGIVTDGSVEIGEVYRFPNGVIETDSGVYWDFEQLFAHTIEGLALAARRCDEVGAVLAGIGVDAWGVDWAYLSACGEVELPARAYRGAPDPAPAIERRTLSPRAVYARSGVIDHSINTALRLSDEALTRRFAGETLVFTPDLWIYWLTGAVGTDPTIASTSQLVDPRSGLFSNELVEAVGIGGLRLPPVLPVGSLAGLTTEAITARLGVAKPVTVFRVAGHDTACAFAFSDPGAEKRTALISSGTWSLVGVALDAPANGEAARAAGFTNERGAAGVLAIRNLTGLWMLQECAREWEAIGHPPLSYLIAASDGSPFDERTFDIADDRLFGAGGMEGRIRTLCVEAGRPMEDSPISVVQAVLDSLAAGYAESIRIASAITGVEFDHARIVGGGSRNEVLCARTATLTGLPVLAGPVEATAIGNLAIQANADLAVSTVEEFYGRLTAEHMPRVYHPEPTEGSRR